jgi:hypothetical protein
MTEQLPRPAHDAPLNIKALWLLECYGYHAEADRVVELYETSERCMLTPAAFQRLFRSWTDHEGRRKIAATGGWECSDRRINIKGVLMRPDKPFPIFEEGGLIYKNTYRKPEHMNADNGDVRPFVAFMERFVPNTREREWLFDWLTHKMARPWIPGTCVVFVAVNENGSGRYGTGRGMFFRIMYKLFGEHYAGAQNFNMLDGSSGQHIYNDWMHNNLLITVDEARTSATAYRKGERNSMYELLKDIIDPAPKMMNFKAKYGLTFTARSYCSFMIASNHKDALAIPGHDRRFTVLRNGEAMTREEQLELAAWMEVPENIAALARWLEIDIGDFNMFHPLKTEAKEEMAEQAITRVEEAINDLREDPNRGLVFTRPHFEDAVEEIITGGRGRLMHSAARGELDGLWKNMAKLLKTDKGRPCTIRIDGYPAKIYCFADRVKAARGLTENQRRTEAAKWGSIDGGRTIHDLLSDDG